MPKICAIVVAGGISGRMGGVDKTFLEIGGQTVLARSVALFERQPEITDIVVVIAAENRVRAGALCAPYHKVRAVTAGGDTRMQSVKNGIAAAPPDTAFFAIHDAARPFAEPPMIARVIAAAVACGGAAPMLPLKDTVKIVDAADSVVQTPDRGALRAVATPQVFDAARYRAACAAQTDALDDCQVFERAGYPVQLVPGQETNIKITTPDDIRLARMIAGEPCMRVGQGYDVHRLVDGRKLILGGVEIPFEKGLLGHSDADVLAHAVSDALLGAAGMGDIGKLFPDTDSRYAGADSIALLVEVAEKLRAAGYGVANIDATVICQRPKLAPHIPDMVRRIAAAAGVAENRVNVKATTEEGLGFTGTGEGIAAQAVAVIE